MRRTLAASVVALGMAVTVTPTVVSAAAGDGGARGPGQVAAHVRASVAPLTAHDRAARALQRAQALFSHPAAYSRAGARVAPRSTTPAHRDATLVMRDLFSARDDLTPAEQQVADRILARPTDGGGDPFQDGYTVPSVKKCQGNFCIHWVTSTEDAPPSQAWVNQMLRLMNHVWKKEVNKLGYRPPVSDAGRGGNSKFDVYLAQIGDEGLYGYCAPERRKPGFKWLASGYCVLDNDFTEFPLAPMQSAEVTAAHEFFHAIQFGYDYGEDAWLLEATATWMEERVFDDVNDNRQYLSAGQVANSFTPLDFFDSTGSEQYGNWPFFEFLSQNYGNGVVQQIWNKAAAFTGAPDMYSTKAISAVLKPKGGFKKVYSRFASANLIPSKFYPEGQAWPATTRVADYTLTQSSPPDWQARRPPAAHVLGQLADQLLLLAEEQEVVAQGQGRRSGLLPHAGGVRAGRQAPRLRQALRQAQRQGQRPGDRAVRPQEGEGRLRLAGQRLDAVQVRQALRLLLRGPAHRRRAQLPGSALQVQRRGHQARLTGRARPDQVRLPARRHHAAAVVSVGLLALAVERGWLGPDVGRGSGFCEVPHGGGLAAHLVQPANSLSNLGFVVAGLAVAWRAGRTDLLGDVLPRLRGLPTAYAVVTVLLGPASAAMHATGSAHGGDLDLLSMYLIASFAAAYALMRMVRQGSTFFFQVFLLMVAACELVSTIQADVPVVHDRPATSRSGRCSWRRSSMETMLWRRAAANRRHPHRPEVGRGCGHGDGRGLRDLEPRPGPVVRARLLAAGPRRLAPPRRAARRTCSSGSTAASGSRIRCDSTPTGHDRCRVWKAAPRGS